MSIRNHNAYLDHHKGAHLFRAAPSVLDSNICVHHLNMN